MCVVLRKGHITLSKLSLENHRAGTKAPQLGKEGDGGEDQISHKFPYDPVDFQ